MANDLAIRAEGLGKKYVIGLRSERERYVALRDVLANGGKAVKAKINRLKRGGSPVAANVLEEFWALRDLSFGVERGEVLGIIGPNGAGKSTLLKILSRITEPTTGRVTIRGRVASLLEVGTGFHAELTGRENIFLNGAILGMTRAEIRGKFEEIVDFAGIEKFIDTPVKRYSSGMYVRLAFAVAAHLEPEILIIDEVLAVGDAEFQKKCLGKISDVVVGGRTVLFVSHDLAAIRALAHRVVYLRSGVKEFEGDANSGLELYLGQPKRDEARNWGRGRHTRICEVALGNEYGAPGYYQSGVSPLRLLIRFETDGMPGMSLDVYLSDRLGTPIGMASSLNFHGATLPVKGGRYRCTLELPPIRLATGIVRIGVATGMKNTGWDHYIQNALEIDCVNHARDGVPFDFRQDQRLGSLAFLMREPIEFICDDLAEDESYLTRGSIRPS